MVINEYDNELGVLLERRDDRLAQHEVRAVADERIDLALGCRELHTEGTGDLVAHARVAVLDVVLLPIARPPELVQISGHRPRGADHHVGRRGEVVHRADDLRLRWQRRMRECVEARDFGVPLLREPCGVLAICRIHPVTDPRERLERHPRIRRDGDPALLVHVELGDIHVHEAHVRVLEDRLRRGREVAPSSADPDHEVRILCDAVRRGRSRRADRTERRGMVVRQGSLAGLRLGDGYAGLIREPAQRI